jgi:carbonic anhydrase
MKADIGHLPDAILKANEEFTRRIRSENLPARTPGRLLVVTCMDPRVNLEAIGVTQFARDGSNDSDVRVVRTLGGIGEPRSLLAEIHLTGIRQIVVLMHTDCGCNIAWSKADVILKNMSTSLDQDSLTKVRSLVGEPFDEGRLRDYLGAFEDPRLAVAAEVDRIRDLPFVPKDVQVFGFLYDTSTGKVEAVGGDGTP